MTEATFGHSYFSSNENIYKKKEYKIYIKRKKEKKPCRHAGYPPPPPPKGNPFTTNVQNITLKFRRKSNQKSNQKTMIINPINPIISSEEIL